METPGCGTQGLDHFSVLRIRPGGGETGLLTCHFVHIASGKADTNHAMFYTSAFLPDPYIVHLALVAETGLEFYAVPLFCWSLLHPAHSGSSPLSVACPVPQ